MATHFERLWNTLTYDLEFFLTVNVNRTHWEQFDTVSEDDMRNAFEIIQEAFNDIDPDIQYMCMVALRCTLLRPFPNIYENAYACEDVYDLAVRNVQHVLADHRQRLIESLRATHHAAFVLQKQWLKCYWNPEYKVCKNRLQRDFEELSSDLKRVNYFNQGACVP
jgi:transcription elongation factor GreA-like protein